MIVLAQFLFRLSFGLALGMFVTSPRKVTSGYFRVHLYVTLGTMTLAALVAAAHAPFSIWPPLTAAVMSYVGSVMWLYEKPAAGRVCLAIVSALALWGAWQATAPIPQSTLLLNTLRWLDPLASGLVLGVTMAAMLLGHWYLNTPTMELAPLQRLLKLLAIAVGLRMLLCGIGAAMACSLGDGLNTQQLLFLALRWFSGLVGALALLGMTWQTLKIPNTQSATGLLYVVVIATFLGELTAMLLSAETVYPI